MDSTGNQLMFGASAGSDSEDQLDSAAADFELYRAVMAALRSKIS